MKRLFKIVKVTTAAAAAMAMANSCVAQNDWLGTTNNKWEVGTNWSLGEPPTDPNLANDDRGPVVRINGDADVLFDAATWQWAETNLNTAQTSGLEAGLGDQHWGPGRLLMGNLTTNTGAQTLTFDHGGTNFVNFPNTQSNILGERAGSTSTLNVQSGILELGGNPVRLGSAAGSSGAINLSGGTLILIRSNFQIGSQAGGGEGAINISGGAFRTRQATFLGASGVFNVEGSAATQIGIGSGGGIDGEWDQAAGGVLRTGLDAGGITSILIDDVGDDGLGFQGNVTFAAGSILDPYNAGGANNAWTTVMEWEGSLSDNGLVLSDAAAADWEMRFLDNELQVRNPSLPGATPGDFDNDGNVDLDDVDVLSSNYGPTGANTNQDLVTDGTIDLADHDEFITTLVPDANGVGALIGDLNLDGDVDVSQISIGPGGAVNVGDASVLLASLGTTSGATYAQGDLNGDGDVDVSQISIGPGGAVNVGDASRLLANLGQSTAGAPAASAVPEPGSMMLLMTAGFGVAMRRRKR